MTSVARTLLHPREPGERTWKYLLPVLALAFAARAAIALSGTSCCTRSPRRSMQYACQSGATRLTVRHAGFDGTWAPSNRYLGP